jgi:nitrogen fixation-related uncharacterized protein
MDNARTWKLPIAVLLTALIFGGYAWAQQEVQLLGEDTTGVARRILVDTAGRLVTSNAVALTTAETTEVLVLNTAATAVPTSPLVGRRSVEVQNLGPNAIFCTLGGDTPVVSKSRQLAASGGTWAFDVSEAIVVKCIAGTADQVTGAATIVSEVK